MWGGNHPSCSPARVSAVTAPGRDRGPSRSQSVRGFFGTYKCRYSDTDIVEIATNVSSACWRRGGGWAMAGLVLALVGCTDPLDPSALPVEFSRVVADGFPPPATVEGMKGAVRLRARYESSRCQREHPTAGLRGDTITFRLELITKRGACGAVPGIPYEFTATIRGLEAGSYVLRVEYHNTPYPVRVVLEQAVTVR